LPKQKKHDVAGATNKAKLVNVRVLPEQQEAYRRAARRSRMAVSTWMRLVCDRASGLGGDEWGQSKT